MELWNKPKSQDEKAVWQGVMEAGDAVFLMTASP